MLTQDNFQIGVMLVEDEVLIRVCLMSELEAAGFSIAGDFGSVISALNFLESNRPTVAVLDFDIAGRVVTPVAQRLRELEVPFVIVSANIDKLSTLDPAFDSAPQLGKPVHPRILVRTINKVLQERCQFHC